MADKCYKCLFADEMRDMGATIPVCNREEDFIEAVNARSDTEPCPWYITMKRIIELQNDGLF